MMLQGSVLILLLLVSNATPALQQHNILTTRTDYVNKYPSTLQTTCYNFSETDTSMEVCVGLVKAPGVHSKNPCQHAADLKMIEQIEDLGPSFLNMETGEPKKADCIRVDGAGDEGPNHEEVQFYWTERHIRSKKLVTMVTTRSSGSSYLNRVELQNGCLALGHANTFIPSTLGGSCMNPDTGQIDEQKLKTNMNLAIDAYISRVSGCPCGNTTIQLYRGADSSQDQVTRSKLLFLKGSKKQKLKMQQENPELYSSVWEVRNSHMIHGFPPHYMFLLYCCFKKNCFHPCCKAGKPQKELRHGILMDL